MLLDALDHGEEDLERGASPRTASRRARILARDAQGARSPTPICSSRASESAIERGDAPRSKRRARARTPRKIHARIEALDDATKAFAGRRMNRAIARAIEGKQRRRRSRRRVEHAKGIEAGARARRIAPWPVMPIVGSRDTARSRCPSARRILEAAQKVDAPEGYACGGVCACSTCHVYVRRARALLSEQEDEEDDILDKAFDVRATSRLGCQSKIVRDGEIEVEITRESLEAFENEHPDERGKYTKR